MSRPSIREALNAPPSACGVSVGGQALIEGIMMRNKEVYAFAVRTPGGIVVRRGGINTSGRPAFMKLPIVRGSVALFDSMVLGMRLMSASAELAIDAVPEPEKPSRFEAWLERKFGDKLTDYVLYVSVALSLVLGVGLFILLPAFIASFINPLIGENTWALGIVEGVLRIMILVAYVFLISRMKDVQRVFQYHGAEHKAINCLESGRELSVENVLGCSRLHKRCGTSFLLFVMVISMVAFFFVQTDVILMRMLMRIVLVPIIAGTAFEVIRWAGRSASPLVKLVSAPGMYLQLLTTREPDATQAEVAIRALNEVLEDTPEGEANAAS